MSKRSSSSGVRQAIDRAVGRVRAYGIDGPRPIEEIEAVLQHGDDVGPALTEAIEAADKSRLAAAIHLGALLRNREALPAIETAAFANESSLEAKREAIRAFEACGQSPPAAVVEQLEVARGFLASPQSAALETVLAWTPAWRSPVIETWLDSAEASQTRLVACLLGKGVDFDRSALEWLGNQSTQEAVEIVQAYLAEASDRGSVKDAKRALHRLKSKGLEVEGEDPDESAGTFSLALEAHVPDRAQAYSTSVDGQGSHLLWVLWPSASGGNRLLQAVVEDRGGLIKADLIAVSRNEFRAHLERLRQSPALLVGRIGIQEAASELASAAARSKALEAPVPTAYDEWAKMAAASGVDVDAVPGERAAGIYDHLDAEAVAGRDDLIDAAMELLREPFFSSWAVTGGVIDRAVEKIRDAERSTLMINEEQRQRQMQDALREAVSEAFDDGARKLYRRRLEAMAGMLWVERGEAEAEQALAAAVGFTELSDLFERHAFARALVHRGIWLAYQESARKDAAEQGRTGVVRP